MITPLEMTTIKKIISTSLHRKCLCGHGESCPSCDGTLSNIRLEILNNLDKEFKIEDDSFSLAKLLSLFKNYNNNKFVIKVTLVEESLAILNIDIVAVTLRYNKKEDILSINFISFIPNVDTRSFDKSKPIMSVVDIKDVSKKDMLSLFIKEWTKFKEILCQN